MADVSIKTSIDNVAIKGINAIQAATGKLTGGFKALGGAVFNVKTLFTGLAGALGAADIIKTGANFEHQMKVVGAVSRASEKDLVALAAAAKQMGATTEFTATQAAEGLQFLSMAGFDAKKSIAALPSVIDLATAGNISLAESADLATNVLSGFGLKVEGLTRVNDILISTATRSNTNVREMAEAFKYVAPVAAGMKVSIEDTATYLGILANSGIKASDAGTDLRQAFVRLPAVFKELGINGEGKSLIDALRGARDAGWDTNKVMEKFGLIAGKSALVLMQNVDTFGKFRAGMAGISGITGEIAGKMRDDVVGSFKTFQSTLESLKIDIFEQYKDRIKSALEAATKFLRNHREDIFNFIQGTIETFTGISLIPQKFRSAFAKVQAIMFEALGAISEYFAGRVNFWIEALNMIIGVANKVGAGLEEIQKVEWGRDFKQQASEAWQEAARIDDEILKTMESVVKLNEKSKKGWKETLKTIDTGVKEAAKSLKDLNKEKEAAFRAKQAKETAELRSQLAAGGAAALVYLQDAAQNLANRFLNMVLESESMQKAFDKLDAAVRPLADIVGEELAPLLDYLTKNLIKPLADILKPYVRILGARLLPIFESLQPILNLILMAFEGMQPAIQAFSIYMEFLTPFIKVLADIVSANLNPQLIALVAVTQGLFDIFQLLRESAERVKNIFNAFNPGGGGGGVGGSVGDAVGGVVGVVKSIGKKIGLARGGEVIASSPRLMMVGENGAEKINVSPLSSRGGSGGGVNIVINGGFVGDTLAADTFSRNITRQVRNITNRNVV